MRSEGYRQEPCHARRHGGRRPATDDLCRWDRQSRGWRAGARDGVRRLAARHNLPPPANSAGPLTERTAPNGMPTPALVGDPRAGMTVLRERDRAAIHRARPRRGTNALSVADPAWRRSANGPDRVLRPRRLDRRRAAPRPPWSYGVRSAAVSLASPPCSFWLGRGCGGRLYLVLYCNK